MKSKFIGTGPMSKSYSPPCGDHFLMQRWAQLEEESVHIDSFVVVMLSGNDDYFIIIVMDAGLLGTVPR